MKNEERIIRGMSPFKIFWVIFRILWLLRGTWNYNRDQPAWGAIQNAFFRWRDKKSQLMAVRVALTLILWLAVFLERKKTIKETADLTSSLTGLHPPWVLPAAKFWPLNRWAKRLMAGSLPTKEEAEAAIALLQLWRCAQTPDMKWSETEFLLACRVSRDEPLSRERVWWVLATWQSLAASAGVLLSRLAWFAMLRVAVGIAGKNQQKLFLEMAISSAIDDLELDDLIDVQQVAVNVVPKLVQFVSPLPPGFADLVAKPFDSRTSKLSNSTSSQ